MSKLSIIIPAYNEEEHIEAVVREIVEQKKEIMTESGLTDIEVIVVNDG